MKNKTFFPCIKNNKEREREGEREKERERQRDIPSGRNNFPKTMQQSVNTKIPIEKEYN